MILSFVQLLLWLQPAATGAGGGSGGGGSAGGGSQYCMMQAGIMVAVLLFTYFFMIRPEQKRRDEAEALLKSLRKGMKVRTTGGILGEIISMDEHTVILGVADKVRINVLRSHIAGPEPEKRESTETKDAKANEDKGTKKPDEARS
ncbi:preprotein translocase subunit YajC [Sandaracinus amylolyticus]|uniref:preprotein translocase subunit YajC n=1 Tax=Sandaracinus amylolyticus TaxID=927083 RepID=UPI001F0258BB|nr:preprotein translocase subunit YajC [Sandaracinus amylolyticus]UJR79779.1 Sec translocon accessory complex subunit YajC [Sandaracinus amylolyticus]